MADFSFLKNEFTQKWIISAPRRSHRTNMDGATPTCPFCPGLEKENSELYRVGGEFGDSNWRILTIANKFPFTPHHEIVIHSTDHHKNFDELPFSQVELIFQTYKERFLVNKKKGDVYIFHNRGHSAGESIPHPHTQIAVVPNKVVLEIQPLPSMVTKAQKSHSGLFRRFARTNSDILTTEQFMLFCPETSEWPDEVWLAPKKAGKMFGEITDVQLTDLAFAFSRLIQIFDLRHGQEFPFNFYIYPGKNWYLRMIPRIKILGGFELGTGIMVNTQKPKETMAFIKEHFWEPDHEKIRTEHRAKFAKSV